MTVCQVPRAGGRLLTSKPTRKFGALFANGSSTSSRGGRFAVLLPGNGRQSFALLQGAQLGNFIKLTWQVEELGEQKVLRPLMLLMEGYARAHGLQHRKLGPGDPEPMHAEELNFAKIAIRWSRISESLQTRCLLLHTRPHRFSSVLQKDTVFTATRDMFHRMGSMLAVRPTLFRRPGMAHNILCCPQSSHAVVKFRGRSHATASSTWQSAS